MQHIDQTIETVSREIGTLQDLMKELHRLRDRIHGREQAPPPIRDFSRPDRSRVPRGTKPARKIKAKPAEPKETKPRATTAEPPNSFGAAMKAEVRRLAPEFDRATLKEAVEKRYSGEEFMANVTSTNYSANLGYWATHGQLEKLGDDRYRVIDKEFFGV